LQEEGFEYVTDWVLDDQPVELKTRSGSLVNIPYTQENNDVGMMLIQHHKASEYTDRALDQFETLYEESADQPRVMALSCHPYIFGVPHRIKYFRKIYEELRKKPDVCFWTGSQILDWYLTQK
jgi:allantoinase